VEGDAEQPVGGALVALGRDHGVGHCASLVIGEATGSMGAEGGGVVEAQVDGAGHGASGCWKRSGTEGIIGLQRTVQEWAILQGWGGRPMRHEQAQGVLVAALGVLAVTGATRKGERHDHAFWGLTAFRHKM
jgi:hypothetical protein